MQLLLCKPERIVTQLKSCGICLLLGNLIICSCCCQDEDMSSIRQVVQDLGFVSLTSLCLDHAGSNAHGLRINAVL